MAKKIEVTSENYGDLLIEGLREAVEIEEGWARPVKVRRRKMTTRQAAVVPPPKYTANKVVKVRQELGVSQPVFAKLLNVSSSTVRAWEQGTRKPEGAYRRLLEIADKHPKVLQTVVSSKKAAG
jgi:putative transcriptional regulator